MFDPHRGIHVTFNAPVLNLPNNPRTREEHLEFATWYQVISTSRRTELIRRKIRQDLDRYTTMELRALFLFAVVERNMENRKGSMLNALERAFIWDELYQRELIDWTEPTDGNPPRPVATDESLSTVYPSN